MRRYPVDNRIKVAGQIPFGQPDPNARYGRHAGDDSANGIGTNVYAAASGVVTGYVSSTFHGNVVEIQTPDGFFPHTLHLSQRLVSPGQTVQVGQLIGKTGNTGLSTGPHIHFGVSRKSLANVSSFADFVDPLQWINEKGADMPVKTSLSTARIVASDILGRDRAQTHAGAFDADLNANHVNRDLTNEYVLELWRSTEANAAAAVRDAQKSFYETYSSKVAELSSRPTRAELEKLAADLTAEQQKVAAAEKALAEEQAKKSQDTILLDEGKGVLAWVSKLLSRLKQ